MFEVDNLLPHEGGEQLEGEEHAGLVVGPAGHRVVLGEVLGRNVQKRTPELLIVADVQTHICSNFLRICSKSVLFNTKQEKRQFFMILAQFDNIIRVLHVFMAF